MGRKSPSNAITQAGSLATSRAFLSLRIQQTRHAASDRPVSIRRRKFEIVDGAPNDAERIPIQLEALLAEEEREEESGVAPCFEDGVI